MGSAAELTEPTTGTEKPQLLPVEEEDELIVDLERKTSRHGKRHDTSAESSTLTTATNTSSSSSSSSGGETPDFRINGEGEHFAPENLEVPETPEKETEIGFHEEHNGGNNCIVYLDGEQGVWKCRHCDWTYKEGSLLCKGSESAGHESQTADHLNGEKKQLESENGSTSKDNKASREIEEVQDGDVSKDLDAVDHQPDRDAIEEELDIEDVEDYDVENVIDKQKTHDLFCPKCDSCITKIVVLKRRKVKIHRKPSKRPRVPPLSEPPLSSGDNPRSVHGGESSEHESFMIKCLSCFTFFLPSGLVSKPIPPREGVEGSKTQPNPQEKATGDSSCLPSIFGFNKKGSALKQDEALPRGPKANPPRDNNLTGSTAENPTIPPAQVPRDPSVDPDIKEKEVAKSHDTSKVVNNGAIVEDGLAPSSKEQTQQKINNDDSSPVDGNYKPDKGRLSPIQPSPGMSIVNTVTNGPDGFSVETTFHEEGAPHLPDGIDTIDTTEPDFGLTKVTGGMDTGERGVIPIPANPDIDISVGLEDGFPRETLIVEGRKLEILKSIVYGGLLEAITSLGVISSAAGSGASMLNILVLGIANLLGGLILIIHNLQELREEEPIRTTTTTTTEDNQTNSRVEIESRYKRLLGRRENFTLHASVAVLSFIIVGLLPPVVYYFSFSQKHNKDYKVVSVFGASLFCIVLLAIAKAQLKYPRGSYLKSILYYSTIAVSVSGISYVVGKFLDHLLEKYGWSDGSETPAGQMMLSSLMGRKAGYGYSSHHLWGEKPAMDTHLRTETESCVEKDPTAVLRFSFTLLCELSLDFFCVYLTPNLCC